MIRTILLITLLLPMGCQTNEAANPAKTAGPEGLPITASAEIAAKPAGTELDGDWAKMRAIVPRGYVCRRAGAPIVIDGKADDPAWADAPWTADFVDIEGDRRPAPRFRTRAKMLWDDEGLYVLAELAEPHVWGTITKKNAVIFHDPDFEIFIDPDGDN